MDVKVNNTDYISCLCRMQLIFIYFVLTVTFQKKSRLRVFILYWLSDSKKSLERVFQKSLCHPNMAMVIDDRMDVWDEKDKRRVPGLQPISRPWRQGNTSEYECLFILISLDNRSGLVRPVACILTDQVAHGRGVLEILRNTISKVHQGFFRFIYKTNECHL